MRFDDRRACQQQGPRRRAMPVKKLSCVRAAGKPCPALVEPGSRLPVSTRRAPRPEQDLLAVGELRGLMFGTEIARGRRSIVFSAMIQEMLADGHIDIDEAIDLHPAAGRDASRGFRSARHQRQLARDAQCKHRSFCQGTGDHTDGGRHQCSRGEWSATDRGASSLVRCVRPWSDRCGNCSRSGQGVPILTARSRFAGCMRARVRSWSSGRWRLGVRSKTPTA